MIDRLSVTKVLLDLLYSPHLSCTASINFLSFSPPTAGLLRQSPEGFSTVPGLTDLRLMRFCCITSKKSAKTTVSAASAKTNNDQESNLLCMECQLNNPHQLKSASNSNSPKKPFNQLPCKNNLVFVACFTPVHLERCLKVAFFNVGSWRLFSFFTVCATNTCSMPVFQATHHASFWSLSHVSAFHAWTQAWNLSLKQMQLGV